MGCLYELRLSLAASPRWLEGLGHAIMVSTILDANYSCHDFIYLLELLFTASLLALVLHLLLRGPVNCVATRFIGVRGEA